MGSIRLGLSCFLLTCSLLLAGDGNSKDAVDKVMGLYEGRWATDDADGPLEMRAVALGKGDYRLAISASINGEWRHGSCECKSQNEADSCKFVGTLDMGEHGKFDLKLDVKDGKAIGTAANTERTAKMDLTWIERKSPTLGKAPPAGAVVLFDGTTTDRFKTRDGSPCHWEVAEGVLSVPRLPKKDNKKVYGDILSKDHFEDFELHLEFMTPFMPEARGQGRGNSGCYLRYRYEVQILDSFGLPPRDNEAGGIYQKAIPTENASLPPGQWQTYDITFKAPRFAADGSKTADAEITVLHNGIKIHDQVKLDGPTPGGLDMNPKSPGGILLQDHGNPVKFRNIWVLPIKS